MDALHVACAESADVDVFLTTDDQLTRAAARAAAEIRVAVQNSLSWVSDQLRGERNGTDT
jgi:hypothetical protein